MAKLSQPADVPQISPAAARSVGKRSNAPAMPSSALYSISLEASPQSHNNDNQALSPPRRGSGSASLLPTDCRTLEKVLRDVGSASPPPTPSPAEVGEQLFANTDDTGIPAGDNAVLRYVDFHTVGDETIGSGYEDEDDSMELSEGVEDVTAEHPVKEPGSAASRTVSYCNRRLQDSISTHDEKDRLRYSGRRPSVVKHTASKHPKQDGEEPKVVEECATLGDVVSLSDKQTPPTHLQNFGRSDSDRQPISNEIKQLNQMHFTMEKVPENELVQQEYPTHKEEPGILVQDCSTLQNIATAVEESDIEAFAADKEADLIPNGTTVPVQSDIPGVFGALKYSSDTIKPQHSEDIDIHKSTMESEPVNASLPVADATFSVPKIPIAAAIQALDHSRIEFATNQIIPETPFTKTLSYFKQYKGAENYPSKRRRNTALPQEIATVAEAIIDSKELTESKDIEKPQHLTPSNSYTSTSPTRAILTNFVEMAPPQFGDNSKMLQDFATKADELHQAPIFTDTVTHETLNKSRPVPESRPGDSQKQLIVYPQHPAFVNAIGMIPATMFWMTAAPIVRYTNIAVDLLIDKLRDTYL